jgi:hypothetical protein
MIQTQVAPNTLLALTEDFLILIEEQRALYRQSSNYGWIITHIPRVALADVTIEPRGPRQELAIRMARGGAVAERRVILGPDATNLWRKMWSESVLP